MTYQPRYVAYARAHGLSPDAMLERDQEAWPGGCMAGFMLWIQERWREWASQRPGGMPDIKTEEHHRDFDAWLARLVEGGALVE